MAPFFNNGSKLETTGCSSLRAALARAERHGEIERRTATTRSLVVEATLFGSPTTGQAGATDEADAMLRGLTTEIRRWLLACQRHS